MKIEDIVEALNKCILDERNRKGINVESFLVLHKSIIPSKTFKAYKELQYTIWCICGKDKYNALDLRKSFRITNDSELEATKHNMEMELCVQLFNWKGSYNYEQIVNGHYETN